VGKKKKLHKKEERKKGSNNEEERSVLVVCRCVCVSVWVGDIAVDEMAFFVVFG